MIFKYFSKCKDLFLFGEKNNKEDDKDPKEFQNIKPLAPINNLNQNYTNKVFDYALQMDSITNIGIIGEYGAGKSSFINSHINNSKNKLMTRDNTRVISLSKFDLAKKTDNDISSNDKDMLEDRDMLEDKDIEEAMIRQLYYSLKPKMWKLIWNKYYFEIIFIILFFLTSLILYYIQSLTSDYAQSILEIIFSNYLLIVSTLPFLTILSYFVRRNLSSFQVYNFKIDFRELENTEGSPFDSYTQEIIEALRHSKVEYIIFEDIDRLSNHNILVKLKELNTLINSVKSVKFIYSIKNDVFISEEKTKFFDFIIPIIPVTNLANSYETLQAQFEGTKYFSEDNYTQEFFYDMSMFLSDRRVIQNLYNEFVIIKKEKEVIEDSTNDATINKLIFTMLMYKNLFKKDYSFSLNNEGLLYFLVKNLKKIKEEYIKKLEIKYNTSNEEKLTSIAKDKENMKKFLFKSIILDRLFSSLNTHYNTNGLILLNGRSEVIERNLNLNTITEKYFDILDDSSSYKIRLGNKEFDLNNSLGADMWYVYQRQIDDHLEEIEMDYRNDNYSYIKSQSLSEFYTDVDYKDLQHIISESNINIEDEKLLEFIVLMIQKGYINENFNNILVKNTEKGINNKDLHFLKDLKIKNEMDFDYSFDNIDEVAKRLHVREYANSITLFNKELLVRLINTQEEEKLKKIFALAHRKLSNHTLVKNLNELFIELYHSSINIGHLDLWRSIFIPTYNSMFRHSFNSFNKYLLGYILYLEILEEETLIKATSLNSVLKVANVDDLVDIILQYNYSFEVLLDENESSAEILLSEDMLNKFLEKEIFIFNISNFETLYVIKKYGHKEDIKSKFLESLDKLDFLADSANELVNEMIEDIEHEQQSNDLSLARFINYVENDVIDYYFEKTSNIKIDSLDQIIEEGLNGSIETLINYNLILYNNKNSDLILENIDYSKIIHEFLFYNSQV